MSPFKQDLHIYKTKSFWGFEMKRISEELNKFMEELENKKMSYKIVDISVTENNKGIISCLLTYEILGEAY